MQGSSGLRVIVTTLGVVVVGLGLKYVIYVDMTVGPALKTVVMVRMVAEG